MMRLNHMGDRDACCNASDNANAIGCCGGFFYHEYRHISVRHTSPYIYFCSTSTYSKRLVYGIFPKLSSHFANHSVRYTLPYGRQLDIKCSDGVLSVLYWFRVKWYTQIIFIVVLPIVFWLLLLQTYTFKGLIDMTCVIGTNLTESAQYFCAETSPGPPVL
jgi:hypothetical protein